MIRPTSPDPPALTEESLSPYSRGAGPSPDIAYDRDFWLVYVANTSLMVAVSLLFRYGDFVAARGGTEFQLGLIVGVGAVGSVLMRFAQGAGMDRYGARRIWLLSLTVVIASILLHLVIQRVDAPGIYLLRIAYHTGLAGAFGASITFISLRAPPGRIGEQIGILGSSGFVGMAAGTLLGDWLARSGGDPSRAVDRLFVTAAAMAGIAFFAVASATRREVAPARRRRPPLLWLVRRYHPGSVLVMGLAMGFGLGLPGTFLRPHTASLGIESLGAFFGVYAAAAFTFRLLTRKLPDRLGARPTILLGMTALLISLLLYLPVRSTWQLVIPAVFAGFAHALLFPAVLSAASISFPARYRGLAVTLILAMFDVGSLVGMPLAGALVTGAQRAGLPGYATMYLSVATLLAAASIYYAVASLAEQPGRRRQATRTATEVDDRIAPVVALETVAD